MTKKKDPEHPPGSVRAMTRYPSNSVIRKRTKPVALLVQAHLGNVVGKADRRGNLYPTKQRSDQKIDAAVALMMAIGRAMSEEDPNAGLDGFLSRPLFV
jgi:phage terminase large subunit-like protein